MRLAGRQDTEQFSQRRPRAREMASRSRGSCDRAGAVGLFATGGCRRHSAATSDKTVSVVEAAHIQEDVEGTQGAEKGTRLRSNAHPLLDRDI